MLIVTFALLNVLIILYRQESAGAKAQIGCRQPPLDKSGIRHTWPQNWTVSVIIDRFWDSQKVAVEDAFTNWENSRVSNCSGVSFSPATVSTVPAGIRDGS